MSRSTVNLPVAIAEEIRQEAQRLDRSIVWLLTKAWRDARPAIRRLAPPPKEGERNEGPSALSVLDSSTDTGDRRSRNRRKQRK